MLEALVFDLDGTMVDTDPIHLCSYSDVLTPYGIRVDRDLFRGRVSGRKTVEVFEDFLPDLSAEERAALAEEKVRLDIVVGLLLAVSPWLLRFSHEVWLPHLLFGVFEILLALLTRQDPRSKVPPTAGSVGAPKANDFVGTPDSGDES
jgi:phosphoglycolate phosphatase-like HAD superfamily hydrolase